MLSRRVLAVAPVPVALLAVLLPWSASGSTARSAFALAHALQGTGALSGWEDIALRAAYVFPVIAACSLAAAVLGRIRTSAAFSAATAMIVVVASLVAIVELGPGVRLGAWVGAIGSVPAIGISLAASARRSLGHV
ncbi:MAG: hypothetical protein WB770_01840 [Acidimicrobiales bacterium]